MRIVIDLQGGQTESRFRGIGRYSLALTKAIVRNAGEHEIWLVLNAAFPESIDDLRQAFDGLLPQERIRVFELPGEVAERFEDNLWRARAMEPIREQFIAQLRPDVVLLTSLFEGYIDDAVTSVGAWRGGAKTAVILYDLIPLLNPAAYLAVPGQLSYYQRKVDSLQRAGMLLAISEHSRQEAVEALNLPADNVVNISAAVEDSFQPDDSADPAIAALLQRIGISRSMVLYVPGGFDSRKNVEGLIEAYQGLPAEIRQTHQLVVASKLNDTLRQRLAAVAAKVGLANDELVLPGYLSDEELIWLYRAAALFVFPSRHEGFGLPALEAMACGAPVIGADSTSIPEVIGWKEALFDAASTSGMRDKMAQALQDAGFRAELLERGRQQAASFSWDRSAKLALQAMADLALRPADEEGQSVEAALPAAVVQWAGFEGATEQDLMRLAQCMAVNLARHSPPQLLLDVTELAKNDAKSGIQRVVRSLLRELLDNPPPGYQVKAVFFDGRQFRYANRFVAKLVNGQSDEDAVVDFCPDDVYLSLDLNVHQAPVALPQFLQLRRRGVKLYFIVYDILLLQRPDWWPAGISQAFEQWLGCLAQAATGLVCISDAVAIEVKDWLELHDAYSAKHRPWLASFHLGADIENSLPTQGLPENAADVLSRLQQKPSFLMVGTIEPRKGHAQALAAFERLWRQGVDVNLAVVGKQGWLMDQWAEKLRKHPELGQRLFWFEGVSDEYLQKIYAACSCLIAASEGEGFGLPLIEAAQHGMPIVARDIPVFREVAGEHAFYFDGLNAENLSDAVEAWLGLFAGQEAPSSADMSWLTWRQSAQQLLNALQLQSA